MFIHIIYAQCIPSLWIALFSKFLIHDIYLFLQCSHNHLITLEVKHEILEANPITVFPLNSGEEFEGNE